MGALLLVAVVAVGWGAISTASAAPPAINKQCPVLTEEEADPKITTSYQGKTVAFCCKRCRAKFKADPEGAQGFLSYGEFLVPEQTDRPELAALAYTASAILNLDETITKD